MAILDKMCSERMCWAKECVTKEETSWEILTSDRLLLWHVLIVLYGLKLSIYAPYEQLKSVIGSESDKIG